MRRVVLVLATMALAILVAGGVAQAIEIEKDRPAYVSFDPTYKSGSSRLTKGTPYLHPKYCIPTPEDKVDCSPEVPTEALVLRELRYDVGVVVLEEPVKMATYGALPEAGLVDTLKEGQRLTTVGYGATDLESGREPPPRPQLVYPDDRYRGTVRLLTAPFIVAAPGGGSRSERGIPARLRHSRPPMLDPSPLSGPPWCGRRPS
jgi:hypothetical protein